MSAIVSSIGKSAASSIKFTPVGNISAISVQDAIAELDSEKAPNNQYDTGTLFIPAGSTFSPPIRAGRNRTYDYLWVDCCASAGAAQIPTSLTVSIYVNGTSVYTSPAITTAATAAAINLTINAGDLVRVVASNTTGLTGGVSVSLRQVNR